MRGGTKHKNQTLRQCPALTSLPFPVAPPTPSPSMLQFWEGLPQLGWVDLLLRLPRAL